MGYWLVIAMAICAVIAVAIAAAAWQDRASGVVRRRARPGLNWLAVVGKESQASSGWPEPLRTALPLDVEGRVVAVSGQTLQDLRPTVDRALAKDEPNVLLIWTSLDDLLAGVALDEHEQALSDVLTELERHDVVPVVGGLPDLTTWSVAREANLPGDELTGLLARWNASIGRLVHASGGLFVDLSDLREPELQRAGAVAERFVTSLRRALVLAHRRSASAASLPV
jgi:hypothetical protein